MKDDFSVENLQKFLESYTAGTAEEYIKSEDVPDNEGQDVKVAVAKNFDELVTKSEKDVLIEFYAPWCGKWLKHNINNLISHQSPHQLPKNNMGLKTSHL